MANAQSAGQSESSVQRQETAKAPEPTVTNEPEQDDDLPF